MISLPLLIFSVWNPSWVYFLMFGVNVVVHALIDDLKANKKEINLIVDQTVHLGQIVITWALGVCV